MRIRGIGVFGEYPIAFPVRELLTTGDVSMVVNNGVSVFWKELSPSRASPSSDDTGLHKHPETKKKT